MTDDLSPLQIRFKGQLLDTGAQGGIGVNRAAEGGEWQVLLHCQRQLTQQFSGLCSDQMRPYKFLPFPR